VAVVEDGGGPDSFVGESRRHPDVSQEDIRQVLVDGR